MLNASKTGTPNPSAEDVEINKEEFKNSQTFSNSFT